MPSSVHGILAELNIGKFMVGLAFIIVTPFIEHAYQNYVLGNHVVQKIRAVGHKKKKLRATGQEKISDNKISGLRVGHST